MKPIPYGRQNITPEDLAAVNQVLLSDFLTQGPKIAEFEQAFATYTQAKYAVAVANGTAALHLCALALNVNAKSNVITTPITFAASANCVRYCDGTVWFADIDPQTFTLDAAKVEALILSRPRGFFNGIIPVDFAGHSANMEALRKLADEHGLWIIEDACHAPGGKYTDSTGAGHSCGSGNFADLAIFSFHPVKHIACGEGGMITTNNEELYKKLLLLRTHGITKDPALLHENHGGWYYEMQELGYNYRLTDFQAALGTSQLKRANEGIARRNEIAARYTEVFRGMEAITLPYTAPNVFHAYHLYIIQTDDRLDLYNYLRENQVYAQVHYAPVHLMPYYRGLGWKPGDFPASESYYQKCLSLPMYPTLTAEEQQYVIDLIRTHYSFISK